MAKEIIMPKFGMTQEDATIVQWLVKEGDRVEKEDPIAEVTTDKVNMEVTSPADGIVGGIQFQEGDTVLVTQIIAFILDEGEPVPEIDQRKAVEAPSAIAEPTLESSDEPSWTPLAQRIAKSAGVDPTQIQLTGSDKKVTRNVIMDYLATEGHVAAPSPAGKIRATPAARRLAREKEITLQGIVGTGPQGRIQAADVEAHKIKSDRVASPPAFPQLVEEVLPLVGLRKTIADRMQQSAQNAPHIHLAVDVDMSRAVALRKTITDRQGSDQPKVSMTAILIKLIGWALRQHPMMNAYFMEDGIHLLPEVNVGMAVALEDGLIVPVIHQADRKGFLEIAAEVVQLSDKARSGTLLPDDVARGTFTLSNLGMFGIDRFTAILNPPQVGILAVGRMVKKYVPDDMDQPILKPMMSVNLAVDHRVLDGAQAAAFLQTLVMAIEEPASLLS